MPRLRPYKQPEFPDGEFYLSVNEGGYDYDLGRFKASDFVPYEPNKGAVMSIQPGERPVILRVTKQDGDKLHVVDGGGDRFVYTIVPVPA